jgi:IMP dehydrogenase
VLSRYILVEIESIENVTNPSGIAYDLEVDEDHSYNVEGILVHNSICSTRLQTGHGVPSLASVLDCKESGRDVTIIADGGIRNSGDIVKALAAGASFGMVGSLLAGTDKTPGEIITGPDGKLCKVYRGMASKDAQMDWRGKTSSLEGITATVPFKGPTRDIVDQLSNGIASGLSYTGARSISEFTAKARFIKQSTAAVRESDTHILHR